MRQGISVNTMLIALIKSRNPRITESPSARSSFTMTTVRRLWSAFWTSRSTACSPISRCGRYSPLITACSRLPTSSVRLNWPTPLCSFHSLWHICGSLSWFLSNLQNSLFYKVWSPTADRRWLDIGSTFPCSKHPHMLYFSQKTQRFYMFDTA